MDDDITPVPQVGPERELPSLEVLIHDAIKENVYPTWYETVEGIDDAVAAIMSILDGWVIVGE